MIDLSQFPSPENAPAPGECLKIERPEPGLAVLTILSPHKSFPVLDAPLLRDLDAAVTEFEGDDSLEGIVITGRRADQFLAGADVEAIAQITDPEVVRKAVLAVHGLFARIERLAARTVAAVGGPVPGGALELSLSCNVILATDSSKTKIGLPETMLGIIPGWGGSHRLPWRVGVPTALDAILTGRLYPAKKAFQLGIVDRLTKEEYLHRIAADIAMGRIRIKKKTRGAKSWLVDRNPLAKAVIRNQAKKQVDSKAHGNYPAPYRALDLVLNAHGKSLTEAATLEADAVAELATGKISKNLVSIFFASEAAKKLGQFADGTSPAKFTAGAVVGGGVMGAGIASLMAEKGLTTRLCDLNQAALDGATITHRADIAKKLRRKRLTPSRADAAIDGLSVSVGITGVGHAEIAVEAVAEIMGVKRKVFGDLAAAMADDAILATNTSSLSVTEMQEALPQPERVVGMHFFNPVKAMPLVEIVRGAQTSDETVTRTAALAIQLGKTPVVTKDVPGFLVNRLLGPYLDEAVRLFVEGVSPLRIDRLLLQFGMPMGPFKLLDEVGLDIAAHAAKSLHEGYGTRMTPCDAIAGMMKPTRLGKKSGRGFYDHTGKGKPELMDDLAQFQRGTSAMSMSDEEIVERIVLAMMGEGARAFEERVVATAQEFDLATVFGTGFAPFRGGLLKYADAVGAKRVVALMDKHRGMKDVQARGAGSVQRFEPTERLREMAFSELSFHETGPSKAKKSA
ncbi:Fatty acid oxidation complex subunit alpha [Planctomycetes bacterium Poly30]|uniref:enoyl-CoA hydratase n=1 Tax=Saltatorellus ferox TaxID=2528018 RepID=A0A518EPE8_9BACT|nr:Fatty acid oxidation complex subunit alpha [Planctomycetes bacterium Poly30]